MAKFDFEKKGYSIDQVDNYINSITMKYEQKLAEQKDRLISLKKENANLEDRVKSFEDKDKQISQALVFAVEKAEQIENSARKIYDLEVKRIRILYQRLIEIVGEIEEYSPNVLNYGNISSGILELKESIDKVIETNIQYNGGNVKDKLKQMGDNYISNLLNKMQYVVKTQKNDKPKDIDQVEKEVANDRKKENVRLLNISRRLQNINGMLSGKAKDFNEFLKSDDQKENGVAKSLDRYDEKMSDDFKFDFEDAMNPKESLDEIMQVFDFYNDENK